MGKYFKHETAIVDDGAIIGEGSKIWHFAHVRGSAKLGDNVIIGKSSYIDAEVVLGDNVKVQNMVSIYHGVTIGDCVFVGPHVVFTNDLHPRATGSWEIVSTKVDSGVSIGANSTIICGITLGKNCLVGAGSVVTKDVPPHGIVVGNPARTIGWACVCAHKIAGKELNKGSHTITCDHCGSVNEITV